MTSIKEKANAKINLFLDVLAKREDGFHEIRTVMHSLRFGDEITVTSRPCEKTNVRLTVLGNRHLPSDTKNLAVKAAYLFLERAKLTCDVEIKLIKRIPIAAGLAGGSSDAAAVLRAMNKIHSKLFSIQALSMLAAELGSDVVYCLYGKTALCEGRGEIITKLPVNLDYYFVIAIANEHVSTPSAYKKLDLLYSDFDGSCNATCDDRYNLFLSSLNDGKLSSKGMYNIFEEAVLPSCKGASNIKTKLLELGALSAMMSGSGPSVFGVFESLEKAKAACYALREMKYKAYYACSV